MMHTLLEQIRACTHCAKHLPAGVSPIISATPNSKLLIIGQAPGAKVHISGKPWNDMSGDTLRDWMGIDKDTFYNNELIALMPMGFCYPGTGGRKGDLPPRQECAPMWHEKVLAELPDLQCILLVGKYSQGYYLRGKERLTLTDTVRHYKEYLPRYFPLPHPSPRNNEWLAQNLWFKRDVVPYLRNHIASILNLVPSEPMVNGQ